MKKILKFKPDLYVYTHTFPVYQIIPGTPASNILHALTIRQ